MTSLGNDIVIVSQKLGSNWYFKIKNRRQTKNTNNGKSLGSQREKINVSQFWEIIIISQGIFWENTGQRVSQKWEEGEKLKGILTLSQVWEIIFSCSNLFQSVGKLLGNQQAN